MTIAGITTPSISSRCTYSSSNYGLDYLVQEDMSASTPHIFLDSVSGSRSRSTYASNPSPAVHMFLSYAEPKNECSRRFIRTTRGGENSSQTKGMNHRRQQNLHCNHGSTPHLFLSYASDDSPSHHLFSAKRCNHAQRQRKQAILPNEHGVDSSDDFKLRLIHEAVGFELQCLKSFQPEDDDILSRYQASEAAKAIGRAARIAATKHQSTLENSFSLYGSTIDQVICSLSNNGFPNDNQIGDNESMNFSEVFNDTPPEVEKCKPSCQSFVQRQQMEIEFLRLALKELITQIPRQDPRAPTVPTEGVPKTIEFDDEISNQFSAISTPIEDDAPSIYVIRESQPEATEPDGDGDEASFLAESIESFEGPSMPSNTNLLTAVPSQAMEAATTAQRDSGKYRNLFQTLFHPPRHEQQQSKYRDGEENPSERARGLQVQLQIGGKSLKGRYNGLVNDDLPHGQGVLRFENRDLYFGEFQNGMMHGQGTLFCRSQSRNLVVLRGEFQQNEFISETCDQRSDKSQTAGAAA